MSDSSPYVPTTERLALALEAENDHRLAEMIRRAREGFYDDYRSPLVMPIGQLVADLQKLGHSDLAQRAMRGEFDGTREEARAWAESPEGREVFGEFGLSPDAPPFSRAARRRKSRRG